jgi:bifunctional DNA-binding transcriptional regulator/antitoxin component of YhaV-PrlF toxin-antitoxin module
LSNPASSGAERVDVEDVGRLVNGAYPLDEGRTLVYDTYVGSRVGERGQITIEKAIRDELAIYAGDETVQHVEAGRIVIDVVPGRHRRSLAGSLQTKKTRQPEDETWSALREAAWSTPDPDRRG